MITKNKLSENNKETSNLESSSVHITITHVFRSESRPRYVCLLKTLDLVESRPEAMRTVLLFFFPMGSDRTNGKLQRAKPPKTTTNLKS